MPDLSELTYGQLEKQLNQQFDVALENGLGLQLELTEVETKGNFDPKQSKRQAFSAIFRGPLEPVLPQQIYLLRHPTLDQLKIFLVPIGPDQKGMCYEALFT